MVFWSGKLPNEMIPFEQAAGDSGKEKLSSDRKKSPAEPDLGRKAICRDWLGG